MRPYSSLTPDQTATDKVTDTFTMSKSHGDVTRRSLPITMYTLSSNDGIEGLKAFHCEENCWTKSLNVVREMADYMKFWFIEPARCPICGAMKEVVDCMFQISLMQV